MTWVPVSIEFFPSSSGGRTSPPTGPRYVCHANFVGRTGAQDGWSVVLDLSGPEARLRFLVDEAPGDVLVPGLRLTLREGTHVVGQAVVRATAGVQEGTARIVFVGAQPAPGVFATRTPSGAGSASVLHLAPSIRVERTATVSRVGLSEAQRMSQRGA
jgi:hypothetical protein